MSKMKYNLLGDTGLMVSELSFGTWFTFKDDGQVSNEQQAFDIMKAAYLGGVNFFDNAEAYGYGEAETIMGAAVQQGIDEKLWTREDLVLSTKIFFGDRAPRSTKTKKAIMVNRIGLSRKHIIEGMNLSLKRMNLDYVDMVFCHRYDPLCNLEEVVRAFNYLIDTGKTFYWGTSEWTSQEIQEAKGIAARLGLVGPSFDQPQYNLFYRRKVEVEFKPLYPQLGLTIWSPLASGVLSGKYSGGKLPEGSRMTSEEFKRRPDYKQMMEKAEIADKLVPVANELGCTLAQLALAWCIANPNVSTTITGASSVKQVEQNLGCIAVVEKLTPEVMKRIDELIGTKPKKPVDMLGMRSRPLRRAKL